MMSWKIKTGSRCIDLKLALAYPWGAQAWHYTNSEAASSMIYFDFVFPGTIDFAPTSFVPVYPSPGLCDSSPAFRPRSFSDCSTRIRSVAAISYFGRRWQTVASRETSAECGTHSQTFPLLSSSHRPLFPGTWHYPSNRNPTSNLGCSHWIPIYDNVWHILGGLSLIGCPLIRGPPCPWSTDSAG